MKTLALLFLRQVSAGLLIYQPIFIPFLLSRGFSMIDVALLLTIYNIGVLVLDIPTGYFADRFGRKWALAVANLSLVLGTTLIAIGHSLITLIAAELFYALAIAMDSGIHSAYLFEWLRLKGREKQYYRYDALGTFLLLGFSAIGTLAAGYFAEKNMLTPIVLTIALTAIGVPAACFLPDLKPLLKKSKGKSAKASHTHEHLSLTRLLEIILSLMTEPGLRWSLGVTAIWFWSRQYVNLIISPPYFTSLHLPLKYFGLLYSILTLSSGLIAFFSRRLIQKPDLRALTLVGLFLIPASFGIMSFFKTRWGLAGFFLFAIPYGLCTSVTNSLLNRQFDHHAHRATFLSVVDFFVRIFASVLVMVLGWVLAKQGAASSLAGAMIASLFMALLLLPGTFKFAKEETS